MQRSSTIPGNCSVFWSVHLPSSTNNATLERKELIVASVASSPIVSMHEINPTKGLPCLVGPHGPKHIKEPAGEMGRVHFVAKGPHCRRPHQHCHPPAAGSSQHPSPLPFDLNRILHLRPSRLDLPRLQQLLKELQSPTPTSRLLTGADDTVHTHLRFSRMVGSGEWRHLAPAGKRAS